VREDVDFIPLITFTRYMYLDELPVKPSEHISTSNQSLKSALFL
jgi:hypothetical protein